MFGKEKEIKYSDAVKIVAGSDYTLLERGDMIMRDMAWLAESLVNYRYSYDHVEGDRDTALENRMSAIKNNMAILAGELDVYMELAGIRDSVVAKKTNRIRGIANRVKE